MDLSIILISVALVWSIAGIIFIGFGVKLTASK
jgi:hypothetical protein